MNDDVPDDKANTGARVQPETIGKPKGTGNHGIDRRRSKLLSLALRHRPAALKLTLGENGWAPVEAVLRGFNDAGLATTHDDLLRVIRACDKQRFALDDDGKNIRASQGHSLNVDLAFVPVSPPRVLFHGTHVRVADIIRRQGLAKMKRQHVHLSKSTETAQTVGSRRGKVVLFVVDAAAMDDEGFEFFESANGVWLTDNVPPRFLSDYDDSTRDDDGDFNRKR